MAVAPNSQLYKNMRSSLDEYEKLNKLVKQGVSKKQVQADFNVVLKKLEPWIQKAIDVPLVYQYLHSYAEAKRLDELLDLMLKMKYDAKKKQVTSAQRALLRTPY